MYFEAFLKIILAFFSVFGIYSVFKFIFTAVLGYENIRIVLEVDTQEVADNIEAYLREARENCLALCGKQIAVIIRREYLSERLVKKLEYTVETIEKLNGKKTKMINVVGGGTKDKFLSQMTADACGIPVCAGPEEATSIGNLMMQAIAAGEVADLAQAREVVRNSFEMKHYEPTSERAAWDAAYEKFCKLQ